MSNLIFIQNNFEKVAIYFLLAIVISLSGLYGILVKQTIENVVARRGYESSFLELSSAVSDLESQYITFADLVDIKFAKSLGFVENTDVVYTYKIPLERITFLVTDRDN